MSEEERYPFQKLSVMPLSASSEDEYLKRANDSINEMVRKQIYTNIAQNALYILYFIIEEEEQGRDSFTIIENLKRFMLQMAQEDKAIGRAAEEIFEASRSRNRREAKKFEDLLKTKATH